MNPPSERQTIELEIINRLGLHARAAARFVSVANDYQASIEVQFAGQTANGKSIMGLMMLAASQGSRLQVSAEGPDAEQALDALSTLLAERFGEAD